MALWVDRETNVCVCFDISDKTGSLSLLLSICLPVYQSPCEKGSTLHGGISFLLEVTFFQKVRKKRFEKVISFENLSIPLNDTQDSPCQSLAEVDTNQRSRTP